ncbi:hypothetical protein AQUCO_00400583v1 [Aquilegia coerulea]|uniref:F-box associated beta-propeller type 1 domain-containing protein n=1 Tax=Aquilegia coerulea TaxID=218851 RepID=A0A2G5EVP3_AQUCA|nr:hypothetical protein AQUCO_00400583v1 [Aquilegia coerulea]
MEIFFPDEIMFEILTRLPAKSLLRFRSNLENPVKPYGTSKILIGSCNGLVCLFQLGSFELLNPRTRECKIFEASYLRECDGTGYGFGYDSIADEYKVVHMDYREDLRPPNDYKTWVDSQVNVYSVSDTKYRMTFDIPYKIVNGNYPAVYLNGALHWVAVPKRKKRKTIVSFNMREKVFQVLPIPDNVGIKAIMNIGVLGEQICMICTSGTNQMEIWVMKNYSAKDSWTKLCSIEETVFKPIEEAKREPYWSDNRQPPWISYWDDQLRLNMRPLYIYTSLRMVKY